MGYGGKYVEREKARELRAQSWTLSAIAAELGVCKSSVSVWVRDVEFVPTPRSRGHPAGPQHPMRLKKEAEIERCKQEAASWVGELTEREVTMFVLGLYAGEGNKTKGGVGMANTNPIYLKVFVTWLRATFEIDEARLRAALYLHEGLDLEMATMFWSELLGIPPSQFTKPYRAVPDPSIRSAKHLRGCPSVRYSSSEMLRRVMAMIEAVTWQIADPG